ncbi:hypothetical protein NPIL_452581 [Nephila pilipes]|uniref:Uncharacterized protein n=1 Tax=Nephila pilipes TaxID=299642 RepID=A0A8X6Q2V1_NEPPI|nr:hypothetical protein NPIL_452581 [Nephila pilipes]
MIFFTSLNPNLFKYTLNIDSQTLVGSDNHSESPQLSDGSLIIKSPPKNVCVFCNDLKHCAYLRCELQKGIFKIHIRKFLVTKDNVKPTFNGVEMDLQS